MKTKKTFLKVLTILLFTPTVFAAVPDQKISPPLKVLESLKAPMNRAVEQIYNLGPEGYKKLYQVSFNSRYPMQTRWKAFMVMSRIGGEKAQPEITRALKSSEWFMRSAGLLALEKINQKKAVNVARKFLNKDKALMVRAQAIEVLRNDPSEVTKELMWDKLYAKENFHRSRGLWIRKKIVSYLSDYATKTDLKKFKKLFTKNEKDLLPTAFPAFERLLNKKPASGLTSSGQVAYWQSQFKSI